MEQVKGGAESQFIETKPDGLSTNADETKADQDRQPEAMLAKGSIIDVSKRIDTLKEMFPSLDLGTISEILSGNNWDVEVSFEAALGSIISYSHQYPPPPDIHYIYNMHNIYI